MSKIYARVVNGEIVEFPVYENHIKNRAHPVTWYIECEDTVKPKVVDFQFLTHEPEVVGTKVFLVYKVNETSLSGLLKQAAKPDDKVPGKYNPRQVKDIDQKLLKQISKKAIELAQSKLDVFAAERGYDDAKSAITYELSSIPKFSQEAERVKLARDTLWSNFYQYLDKVTTGQVDFPVEVSEIEKNIPEMTW